MYQLEAGTSEQVGSSLRVATINQPARAAFGQPFVVESRDCFEPRPRPIVAGLRQNLLCSAGLATTGEPSTELK
jgi:hypothetical protein